MELHSSPTTETREGDGDPKVVVGQAREGREAPREGLVGRGAVLAGGKEVGDGGVAKIHFAGGGNGAGGGGGGGGGGKDHQGLDWLIETIPGEPGVDYPIYSLPAPDTSFSCDGRVRSFLATCPANNQNAKPRWRGATTRTPSSSAKRSRSAWHQTALEA